MTEDKPNNDAAKRPIRKIRFIYTKARHHRTFHADGAWASITPRGELQFAFFNDLKPMPDEVTHIVKEGNILGEEIGRKHDLMDVIREANVTVVMNREIVGQFITLLENFAAKVDAIQQAQQSVAGENDATTEVSQ